MKTLAVRVLLLATISLLTTAATAQVTGYQVHFPNLPGYETLVCDLHMHTVFSDGKVWPTVRVEEAFRLGYDLIAITDHIEYQEHPDVATADLNRSFTLASPMAKAAGVLLAKGAEITRETPPGHFNAVFLNDVAPLKTKDLVEAIRQAKKQGAFVFWNHHAWQGPEKGRWGDLQTMLLDNHLLDGLEIYNGVLDEYYPEAHRWCLEKNLTMLGDSDSHSPDLHNKPDSADHRTATLVFARKRSLESAKEALLQHRTAVWFKDRLVGRKEILEPLAHECLRWRGCDLRTPESVWIRLQNTSSMDIQLRRAGTVGPERLMLPALGTTLVEIETSTPNRQLTLDYTATNLLIAPDTGLKLSWIVPAP